MPKVRNRDLPRGAVNLRDIPRDVIVGLKIAAAARGMTLRQFILACCRKVIATQQSITHYTRIDD